MIPFEYGLEDQILFHQARVVANTLLRSWGAIGTTVDRRPPPHPEVQTTLQITDLFNVVWDRVGGGYAAIRLPRGYILRDVGWAILRHGLIKNNTLPEEDPRETDVRPRGLIECIAMINRETYNRVTIRLADPKVQLSTTNEKRVGSPAHDNEPRKKLRQYVKPGERGLSKCEDSDDDFILFMGLQGVASDQIGLRLSKMNTNHIPFDAEALSADIDRRFEAILDDPAARADAKRRMNNIMRWRTRMASSLATGPACDECETECEESS